MDNAEQYSVFPRIRATKISTFTNNSWKFTDPGAFTFKKTVDGREYTLLTLKTGILLENETDPSHIYDIGQPNDYLFRDTQGNLSIIEGSNFNYHV